MEAALQLRERSADAEMVRSKRGGKTARQEALDDSSAQRAQRVARLKTEVKKLNETTKRQPKRNRARHLNRRMGADAWPTADALVAFARRENIKM
jgi:hypothetical protein